MNTCLQCHLKKQLILCPYTGNIICYECMLDNEKEFIESERFGGMLGD